ncbi:hypothetical protein ADIARSV_0269 [Arcticibacter svalbardensis MN12-7]|uniref:Addiction module component, TIGR02574 family n=1 Tax=Arcticibacter svalbardensis MN12-7 TaxID=1150600 RepID=R9GYG4_9SPHI|nr:addiction module protein [Arcticibacter svalbardensis]EOR96540.1 hypothetical protein ADIARSV_0269 [Arcticibacter svalbardensis MN12-7]
MATTTIRDRLYDYIRYADDKKVKAIYTMVEDEINEQIDPWEDKEFLKEIDLRLNEFESGNIKTSTWEEVKQKAKFLKKS